MDVSHPYLALLSRVWGATLLALYRTESPLTGREVARRAGVSQPAALEALNHFVEHGLVHSQPAGRAYLYRLNDEHLAAKAIEDVFGMRSALVECIKHSLSRWEFPPEHLSIFGSWARRDGDVKSDIDVLVVRPNLRDVAAESVWSRQIDTLAHEVLQWTGNRAALLEVDWDEVASMQRSNHRLLTEAHREGIVVWGGSLDKVLRVRPTSARRPAATRR